MEKVINRMCEKLCTNEPVCAPNKNINNLLSTFLSSKGDSKDLNRILNVLIRELKRCNIEEVEKTKLVQGKQL